MDWSRARRERREEKRRPWREREKVDRVLPVGACACTAPISGQSDAGDWLAFVRHSGPDLREAVPAWAIVLKLAQVAPFSLQSTRVTMTLRSL